MLSVMGRLGRRVVLAAATCATVLVTLVGVAAAHITTNPDTAQQGSFTKVSFRVPNERDTASTTALEVTFPTDHPIPFVLTRAVPGWTATVQKTKLDKPIKTEDGEVTEVVSKITWTGGKIPPGSFEDFDVSMGPLPTDTDELIFKAVQTYDSGEVVRWIDTTPPGGPEPEHPAPVLKLAPATAPASESAGTATGGSAMNSPWGVALGIAGCVLGLAGVSLGLLNRRRLSAR